MGNRYRGRHRRPSQAGRRAARLAIGGTAAMLPLGLAGGTAYAAPAHDWDAIIACESGGDAKAENLRSTASGLFQFVDSTWQALGGHGSHAADAEVAEQYRVAEKAYAASGLTPWAASKSCWAGKSAPAPKHATKGSTKATAKRKPAPKAPAKATTKGSVRATTSWAAAAAPSKAPTPAGGYVVRPGDTLTRIAAATGRSWQAIYEANRARIGSNPNRIYPGERLSLAAASGGASSTAVPAAAGSSRIVSAATSYFGVPYRWGGTSRSGMDCSGLVYTVLRQAGYSPPRTAAAQAAWAKPIPASQARPGDLVFTGHPATHVGIYIGGGHMIDAPHAGASVAVRAVYPGHYFARLP
jgi:resuscitation-promoting factor RpfA